MNITNFSVQEVFMNPPLSQIEYQARLLKEYDKSDILVDVSKLKIPEIKIIFEVTSYRLKELLKERIRVSGFYIWLAEGLVGRAHSLTLKQSFHSFTNEKLTDFLKKLFYSLSTKIHNELTDIGLKGFVGRIKNLFSNEAKIFSFEGKRKRLTRAFYGKFKYFKVYDKNEAYLINNAMDKYQYDFIIPGQPRLKDIYYPLRIVKGYKFFYIFTNLALLIFSYTKFILKEEIHYYLIENVESQNCYVYILFNQVINGQKDMNILCDTPEIAIEVKTALKEEMINNKGSLGDLYV